MRNIVGNSRSPRWFHHDVLSGNHQSMAYTARLMVSAELTLRGQWNILAIGGNSSARFPIQEYTFTMVSYYHLLPGNMNVLPTFISHPPDYEGWGFLLPGWTFSSDDEDAHSFRLPRLDIILRLRDWIFSDGSPRWTLFPTSQDDPSPVMTRLNLF